MAINNTVEQQQLRHVMSKQLRCRVTATPTSDAWLRHVMSKQLHCRVTATPTSDTWLRHVMSKQLHCQTMATPTSDTWLRHAMSKQLRCRDATPTSVERCMTANRQRSRLTIDTHQQPEWAIVSVTSDTWVEFCESYQWHGPESINCVIWWATSGCIIDTGK